MKIFLSEQSSLAGLSLNPDPGLPGLASVRFPVLVVILSLLMTMGCSTNSWNKKVGQLTYEEAVMEYGPPDSSAQLKSGLTTYSWYSPSAWGAVDKIILTFDENGTLVSGNTQFMGNVPPPMGPVFIDRVIY